MSNNKQSMKLYTEAEIMNYLINHRSTITRYDLQNIPHIELPSDEEIEEFINTFPYTKIMKGRQFNNGVIYGATIGIDYMRDKIQGGNNEP